MDIIYVFSRPSLHPEFFVKCGFFFLTRRKIMIIKASLTSRHLQFIPLPVNLKKKCNRKISVCVASNFRTHGKTAKELQMILLIDFKDILWTVLRQLIPLLLKQQQKPKQRLNQITHRWKSDSTFLSYLLFYFTFELKFSINHCHCYSSLWG